MTTAALMQLGHRTAGSRLCSCCCGSRYDRGVRLRLYGGIVALALIGLVVGLMMALAGDSGAAMGTVEGKLALEGGPPSQSGNAVHPVRGTVILSRVGSDETYRTVAATDGTFSVDVPAGTYRLSGKSPLARFGNGREISSSAAASVQVGADHTRRVLVPIFIQ